MIEREPGRGPTHDGGTWVFRPLTDPDEWCGKCLHNDGAYAIPYKLTADGVTKWPEHFRCFNCGEWRVADQPDDKRARGEQVGDDD